MTKRQRNVDRLVVLENSGSVDDHSARYITCNVIKRNNTPGERREAEPLTQGEARLLEANNVRGGHKIRDSIVGQVLPVEGPTVACIKREAVHIIRDDARHQRGAASEGAGIRVVNGAGETRGTIPIVN